jgi:hypothetical protein
LYAKQLVTDASGSVMILDWTLVKCIKDSGCGPVAGLRVLLNQNLRYIHTPGARPAKQYRAS